jgi:hypothetical protein
MNSVKCSQSVFVPKHTPILCQLEKEIMVHRRAWNTMDFPRGGSLEGIRKLDDISRC